MFKYPIKTVGFPNNPLPTFIFFINPYIINPIYPKNPSFSSLWLANDAKKLQARDRGYSGV